MHKTLHRAHNKARHLWWFIAAAAAFFILVAVLVVNNERSVAREHEHTDTAWSLIARPIQKNDHSIGDPAAPIELLVYSDLSCKYCKAFFEQTVPALQNTFGSSTVFVFRHNPLQTHPQAHAEAIAAECVYDQEGETGFWKFVHAVYSDPNFEQGLSGDELRSVATSIGVTGSIYETCTKSASAAARVDKDTLEAAVAGLNVTPGIILKSPHRALTISGNYPNQISSAVSYLLDAEKQIAATNSK